MRPAAQRYRILAGLAALERPKRPAASTPAADEARAVLAEVDRLHARCERLEALEAATLDAADYSVDLRES